MAEFLYAICVGVILGVFYDLLRFLRLSFSHDLFFDLLFWVVAAFVCFCYLLIFNNGSVRGGYFAAFLCGYLLYVLTIGRFFAEKEKQAAKKVKFRLKKVKKMTKSFKKVLQLPYYLYYNIRVILKRRINSDYEGEDFDG